MCDVLETSFACWRPVMNKQGLVAEAFVSEKYRPSIGAVTSIAHTGCPSHDLPARNGRTSGKLARPSIIRWHSPGPIGSFHCARGAIARRGVIVSRSCIEGSQQKHDPAAASTATTPCSPALTVSDLTEGFLLSNGLLWGY